MLVEIEHFVNWVRRRSPDTRTWKRHVHKIFKNGILTLYLR